MASTNGVDSDATFHRQYDRQIRLWGLAAQQRMSGSMHASAVEYVTRDSAVCGGSATACRAPSIARAMDGHVRSSMLLFSVQGG